MKAKPCNENINIEKAMAKIERRYGQRENSNAAKKYQAAWRKWRQSKMA